MMMRNENSRGFTLIEVMVALAIMAIGLVAAWTLHFSSLKTEIRNKRESSALFLANQKLEEFRSLKASHDWEDFVALTDPNAETCDDTSFPPLLICRKWCDDESFYPPLVICWTASSPQVWRRDITVTVLWEERRSLIDRIDPDSNGPPKWRCVQLATIVADLN